MTGRDHIFPLSHLLAGPHVNYSRQDYLILKMEVKNMWFDKYGAISSEFWRQNFFFSLSVSVAENINIITRNGMGYRYLKIQKWRNILKKKNFHLIYIKFFFKQMMSISAGCSFQGPCLQIQPHSELLGSGA